MVSVNYSASSAAALNSLRDINKQIAVSQKRIATGLKVASASDNASVWATATKLKSESSANATITSALSTSQSKAKGAVSVLDSIAAVYGKIKDTLALGYNPSADYGSIDSQVLGYQNQITNLIASANFGGANWLNAAVSESVTTSVSGSTATSSTFAISTAFNAATDVAAAAATLTTASGANATTNIGLINAALKSVTEYSTKISGWADNMDTVKSTLKIVDDVRKTAISELIDADMEEEAARVTALQTQQQLAYQALSIGNSASQNILRLFQ